jgi:hypothetical protein
MLGKQNHEERKDRPETGLHIFTSELFDLSGKGCVICFCPDVQNSGFIDNHRSKRLMEERG